MKSAITQKTINNFEILIAARTQERADHSFPHFSWKVIFYAYFFFFSSNLFLRSSYDSTAFKIWLKLQIIKDITKGNN